MRKTKSDARWNKLTQKQRETLDQWLFDEGLSYAAILPRAQSELGFKGSRGSLQRYYKRRDKERTLKEFTDLRDEVSAIRDAPGDTASTRDATMKLLGLFLFRQVKQSPKNMKEWAPVANLMVDNDRNELLRELKGEELKVRREALEFAKEKYQIDMAEQALDALPELQELAQARRDPQTKQYEENARLNRIRRMMFGVVWEVRPESPQEAAEMLKAKREREARHEAEQEAAAEHERIERELGGPQPPTPSSQYYEEYMEAKAEEAEKEQERERELRESLERSKQSEGENEKTSQEKKGKGTSAESPRKPSKQYQEYLDKLKLWEEKRELLGWEEMPRPEWSGRWPMMEEGEQ